MTLSTTQTSISYLGDGSTTTFPVPFPFYGSTQIEVISRVVATGVETTMVLGSDYTVVGLTDGGGSTGTIQATTAPAVGVQWTIARDTDLTQLIDFRSNGAFPEEAVERGLDRVTAIVQEAADDTARSLRIPVTDEIAGVVLPNSVARANTVLGFDADGVPYAREVDESGILAGPTGPPGPTGLSWEPGAVRWWPGAAIPSGWAVCDGALYSNTAYPQLYAAIGRAWTGGGDPADQFRVPDLRGRAVIGLDNMGGTAASRVTTAGSGIAGTTLGATGGSERLQLHGHTLTDPGHTHSVSITGGTHQHFSGAAGVFYGEGSGGNTYSSGPTAFQQTGAEGDGAHSHSATAASANTGITISSSGIGGSENMPPVAVGNWIIKLDGSVGNGSQAPIELLFNLGDEATNLTTGLKLTWHSPRAFALSEVILSLTAVSTSGVVTLDVQLAGATVFSTKVTVDANEETSLTAATAAVISTANIPKGGKLTFLIDTAGTNAKGAKVALIGTR